MPHWRITPGIVAVLALHCVAASRDGPAPWADPTLAVRDGLELWADVAAQGAAHAAEGRAAPVAGAPVAVVYDASGRRRDFVQHLRASQPLYLTGAAAGAAAGSTNAEASTARAPAWLRFDGVDDFLHAAAGALELEELTLALLVAPRSNAGGFRAFVAASAAGANDYQSGFNVDLSWPAGERFDALNVEGRGFGGALDLLRDGGELGAWRVVTVVASIEPGGAGSVTLSVDGGVQGDRPRDGAPLAAAQWFLGARSYSNDSPVPCATGFLDGDVAELLVWSRALAAAELDAVERYLAGKSAALQRAAARDAGLARIALEPVRPPPPFVALAPGFAARPLPVEMSNVNNLRFREDGVLVALGYDGNVWKLEDRNGDGLEESVAPFFVNRGSLEAPIGMALAPRGRPGLGRSAQGHGVYVACKGKVVLLVDRDGDDVAESEEIVASGWEPMAPGVRSHGVDALGVALAPDGRLFFGLGTADYTNGFLLDERGTAHYDLASERGTILEVAADGTSRRIFCTGIRFPVALAFDRAGELFATDQEGATWLANGNPLDELLWIREGRHYGFPPRHSRHLPGVVDEPSLFDYAPQHQSTCGLCFDEPLAGGRLFGPAFFEGSAFVAGYSRGKLWRTELARTRAGLVARSHLFGCFDQLAADVALAPDGRLLVVSHSGPPDWGSGPKGRGRIDAIRLADRAAPQPLFAWCAGEREVRVAFDRPLDPARLTGLAARARIEFGEAVAAGDRFELHRPGYAVVERQLAAPRHALAVESVRLAHDLATLVVRTAPHALRVPHAIELPLDGRTLACDLGYDLHGVAAQWRPAATDDGGASPAWSGWLPHLDLAAARAFTRGSREHDAAWAQTRERGTLHLRTAIDLGGLLRPAVQPGSRVDDELHEEIATIELRSGRPFAAALGDAPPAASQLEAGEHVVRATLPARRGALVHCEVELPTGGGAPRLDVAYWTADDPRPRALELRRFVPPWSTDATTAVAADAVPARDPELAGANWSRGREVFFGDVAMCSRCHARRDGTASPALARIGPDLSQSWQRDLASLRRDVLEPNATLNPDHLAWALTLADGRVLAGVVREEADGTRVVGEPGGKETRLSAAPGDAIVARELLPASIMPAGLVNVLSARQIDDLLLYLLTEPLEPTPIVRDGAPPARTRAELGAWAAGSAHGVGPHAAVAPPPASVPLRLVLVDGPKDHGAGEHDYPDWQERWTRLLALANGVEVGTAHAWPSPEQFARADVLVLYSANPAWSAARAVELDAFLARGGGLVLVHWAVNGRDAVPELAQRIGLAWRDGASRFRHGDVALEWSAAGREHPITGVLGAAPLRLVDETYWALEGDPASITVLASSLEEGTARPQLWTRQAGAGRVFVSLPGHYRWTFDDPLFRRVLLRGIAWCARQPPERLEALATIGARVAGG